MADQTPRTTGDVLEKTRHEVKNPEQWRVLLLNDDYTPMDFVVDVLESIFLQIARRGVPGDDAGAHAGVGRGRHLYP